MYTIRGGGVFSYENIRHLNENFAEIDAKIEELMRIDVYIHSQPPATDPAIAALAAQVSDVQQKLKELKVTDQEVSDLLDQVNKTTNGIAANQAADAKVIQTVKTELEALIAQGSQLGLSQATSDKLTAMAASLTPVLQNSSINNDLLNKIAAEGAPVVPPPPPAP